MMSMSLLSGWGEKGARGLLLVKRERKSEAVDQPRLLAMTSGPAGPGHNSLRGVK